MLALPPPPGTLSRPRDRRALEPWDPLWVPRGRESRLPRKEIIAQTSSNCALARGSYAAGDGGRALQNPLAPLVLAGAVDKGPSTSPHHPCSLPQPGSSRTLTTAGLISPKAVASVLTTGQMAVPPWPVSPRAERCPSLEWAQTVQGLEQVF